MTQDQALTAARAAFPKQNIVFVTRYNGDKWLDNGWKGWRVTIAGDTIHWLTQKGRHQAHVCCPKERRSKCPECHNDVWQHKLDCSRRVKVVKR